MRVPVAQVSMPHWVCMRLLMDQYDVFEFLLLQRRNAKGEPTVKWELDETWVAETVEGKCSCSNQDEQLPENPTAHTPCSCPAYAGYASVTL